jgi:hypothetical protein
VVVITESRYRREIRIYVNTGRSFPQLSPPDVLEPPLRGFYRVQDSPGTVGMGNNGSFGGTGHEERPVDREVTGCGHSAWCCHSADPHRPVEPAGEREKREATADESGGAGDPLDSHPTGQAVATPDTGDSANAKDAETTGADYPEGSSNSTYGLIGGRADYPEGSSIPAYGLIGGRADYPEGSSISTYGLIGGRADYPEGSSISTHGLVATAALYADPAAALALSENADAAEICLAGDAGVTAAGGERDSGYPVAGRDCSDRCSGDAPYAVARGSHADYAKTIHAGYPAGKLTTDEPSSDQ